MEKLRQIEVERVNVVVPAVELKDENAIGQTTTKHTSSSFAAKTR